MRFQHIIEAVYFQPWAITHEGWNSIHQIVRPHLLGHAGPGAAAPNALAEIFKAMERGSKSAFNDPTVDFFEQPLPKMEISGGIAVIPICGPLIQHADLIELKCGACSYQNVVRNVAEAVGRPDVKKILFRVYSPGGMAIGMLECARAIAQARQYKPTYAYWDTVCASAAFGLVSSCTQLFCAPSALGGSIGTMCAITDTSGMYEQLGLAQFLFTSGKYKGAGTDGVPMRDDWKESFQTRVDAFAAQFFALVKEFRPQISAESMQGQCFVGDDALLAGIADGHFNNIEDVKAWIG